mmetsp:Transcript_6371/g.13150  ORF Transcript_6371/g.13150 Transcript_6371/m.13150 type:complete len:100 (-) Transcript_6371:67-366(-)
MVCAVAKIQEDPTYDIFMSDLFIVSCQNTAEFLTKEDIRRIAVDINEIVRESIKALLEGNLNFRESRQSARRGVIHTDQVFEDFESMKICVRLFTAHLF